MKKIRERAANAIQSLINREAPRLVTKLTVILANTDSVPPDESRTRNTDAGGGETFLVAKGAMPLEAGEAILNEMLAFSKTPHLHEYDFNGFTIEGLINEWKDFTSKQLPNSITERHVNGIRLALKQFCPSASPSLEKVIQSSGYTTLHRSNYGGLILEIKTPYNEGREVLKSLKEIQNLPKAQASRYEDLSIGDLIEQWEKFIS